MKPSLVPGVSARSRAVGSSVHRTTSRKTGSRTSEMWRRLFPTENAGAMAELEAGPWPTAAALAGRRGDGGGETPAAADMIRFGGAAPKESPLGRGSGVEFDSRRIQIFERYPQARHISSRCLTRG